MATLRVDIASEFTGAKAFKQAGKSTSALEKGVKSLGKTMGIALSAQAVVAFGKASVKAFMDDQKSAVLLANAVKNLGIEMEAPAIEGFIQNLSKQAAIADDELRPAMQKLLTQTGSVTKSQELLANAIEISRGSGVALETVTSDLSAAYVGNTKGLRKYNLGLTQAELKTASFADIQEKLNNQFKGSNAAYLDTYAGKMEALTVASGEAQETIGKGLVDALVILVGQDQGISGLTGKFSQLATDIAEVTTGMAAFYKSVEDGGSALSPLLDFMQMANDKLPNIYKVLGWFKKFAPANSTDATGVSTIGEYNESQDQMKRGKARAKLEADAEKRAKILAAAAAKRTPPPYVMPKVLTVALLVTVNRASISMPPPTPIDQPGTVTDASVISVLATATTATPYQTRAVCVPDCVPLVVTAAPPADVDTVKVLADSTCFT